MPSPTEPTPQRTLAAMASVGRAHVCVSRGALPFVLPCSVRLVGSELVVESSHPSVTRGAERRDIAALQVEAVIDGACWSLSVTGPLDVRPIPDDADDARTGGTRTDDSPSSDARHDDSPSDSAQTGAPTIVVLPTGDALFRAECLSSGHGHRIDPLLRSGLAERT